MFNLFNKTTNFLFTNQIDHPIADCDLIFLVSGNNLYLMHDNSIPNYKMFKQIYSESDSNDLIVFGKILDRNCYIYLANDLDEYGLVTTPLRTAYGLLSEGEYQASLMANQLKHWIIDNRYCGACGNDNRMRMDEFALSCKICGKNTYPTISPCVIVLINDVDRILLAKHVRATNNIYTCIAGFINPFENLENAVKREVMEETGLEITNIRYIASQPWPFPNSLMMGFYADYKSGEINIDTNELIDARWYSYDELSNINLPSEVSIARFLIENYRCSVK